MQFEVPSATKTRVKPSTFLDVSDPGDDVVTITVDWGDGSVPDVVVESTRITGFSHTYSTLGSVIVSVTAADEDGGVSLETFALGVVPTCRGLAATIDVAALGLAPGDTVIGTKGADVIVDTDDPHRIIGRAGDDVICAAGGADSVFGGPGDDTIFGGDGPDLLRGSGGEDTLDGEGGADTVLGGGGADILLGGASADLIVGGPGADVIKGGSAGDTLKGGAHDDRILGEGGQDAIDGGGGDDDLQGGDDDDVIVAGNGNDSVNGGGGDDRLFGKPGDDSLIGGDGDDFLSGGLGEDVLRGQMGDDELRGGPDGDALGGGFGNDLLAGGIGDDALHGGPGVDAHLGEDGVDLLFNSESPNLDAMDGGPEDDMVGVGRRGTIASGVRQYLNEAEALAFSGFSKLSDFSTFHSCCADRVVNIQTMANTVSGHVVMPGETFSINATVGARTSAKGYRPAGAIIGGYIVCCDQPQNIGGGTSQFGTTFYNALYFAAVEDVPTNLRASGTVNSPHTLYFSRYPAGREATMSFPDHDIRFVNDTASPILITTHHIGRTGTRINVKFWGDNGGRVVTARHSCRPPGSSTIFPEVNQPTSGCGTFGSSRTVYEADSSLEPGEERVKSNGQSGFKITVDRIITYPNGSQSVQPFTWTYSAGPKVVARHVCEVPSGNFDYTGEACPAPPPPPGPPPTPGGGGGVGYR